MGIKGFTLIELLIVIIIIGLIAAVAIPAFEGDDAGASLQTTEKNIGELK